MYYGLDTGDRFDKCRRKKYSGEYDGVELLPFLVMSSSLFSREQHIYFSPILRLPSPNNVAAEVSKPVEPIAKKKEQQVLLLCVLPCISALETVPSVVSENQS